MLSHNKLLGEFGELIARDYLIKTGYKILKRNYRCKTGEIDIIAFFDETIIFVEVKTRTTVAFGFPEESVNYIKIQKIKRAATNFIFMNKIDDFDIRFDVISLTLNNGIFPGKAVNILTVQEFIKKAGWKL